MTITVARERLAPNLSEFDRLGKAQWEETETYQAFPYNPNFKRYVDYNESGFHIWYAARNEAGEVVGHLGAYVNDSMHTGIRVASEDTLYLMPEYRNAGNGSAILKYVEADLLSMGIKEIRATTKLTNEKIGKVMFARGYQHVANEYVKVINHV